jgi:hypothetical protein
VTANGEIEIGDRRRDKDVPVAVRVDTVCAVRYVTEPVMVRGVQFHSPAVRKISLSVITETVLEYD